MRVFGERARPRLLVVGDDLPTGLAEHLSALVPTIRFVSPGDEIWTVRQLEFDAAVLWSCFTRLEEHMCVVQFSDGKSWGGNIRSPNGQAHFEVRESGVSVSTEFVIPDEVPRAVEQLVESDLLPRVIASDTLPHVFDLVHTAGAQPGPSDRSLIYRGFLQDADGLNIAGRYTRPTNAEWWCVPSIVSHPERWVAAALEEWRSLECGRFPALGDWRLNAGWQTVEELSLAGVLDVVLAEGAAAERAHNERLAGITAEQQVARQQADEGERRLLTAAGDDLVAEVMATLAEFGLSVVDVDATSATKGDKLEDLRIADPLLPGWIALAEVRSYAGGAQLKDLFRISRFDARFALAADRLPDRLWYVVNHFSGTDPHSRPMPLSASPGEVAAFADNRGLVVDTRDLFRLRVWVRQSPDRRERVRRLLRESTGVLDVSVMSETD